jgi:hypothetical protein
MRRRKRFTIKLVALGLAVIGFSATPAQAKLDEGINGLQPMSIQTSKQHTLVPDDRAGSREFPVSSQPRVVSDDDGFELATLGVSGIALVLAVGAMSVSIYGVRRRRMASA